MKLFSNQKQIQNSKFLYKLKFGNDKLSGGEKLTGARAELNNLKSHIEERKKINGETPKRLKELVREFTQKTENAGELDTDLSKLKKSLVKARLKKYKGKKVTEVKKTTRPNISRISKYAKQIASVFGTSEEINYGLDGATDGVKRHGLLPENGKIESA